MKLDKRTERRIPGWTEDIRQKDAWDGRLTGDDLADRWPDVRESYPELGDPPEPHRQKQWRVVAAIALLVLAGIAGAALL